MSMRLRAGCAILVAYPLVELAIAIALANLIGWWWVFVGIIACLVLGLGVVRYSLGATGASLSTALAPLRGPERPGIGSGRPPVQGTSAQGTSAQGTPAQTLLMVPAGLLIAIPGLGTTVLGLVMWLPLVRRRLAARWEAAMRRALPPAPPREWPSGEWTP